MSDIEVAVARRNTGALVFWRNAIAAYPHVSLLEESDMHDDAWDGAILRFQIRPLLAAQRPDRS